MVEIISSSFKPTQKAQSGEFSGSAGTVQVMPGTNGYNRWSFDVDSSTFKPDEYLVKVSGVTVDVTGSTTFILLERPPTTMETITVDHDDRYGNCSFHQHLPLPAPTTQKSPLLVPPDHLLYRSRCRCQGSGKKIVFLPAEEQGLCTGVTVKCVLSVLPPDPAFVHPAKRHFGRDGEMPVYPDDPGFYIIKYPFCSSEIFRPDRSSKTIAGSICTDGWQCQGPENS